MGALAMRSAGHKALTLLVAATLVGAPSGAAAQSAPASSGPVAPPEANNPAERCVAAAERGQVLRDEGRLLESRSQFAACGADDCPAVVRRECVRWLAEIDERTPSIIVSIKSAAGGDVVGATVSVDGKPVSSSSLGRSLPLDPGPHTLRVEHAAHRPLQEQFVVRERERSRVIDLSLEPTEPPVAARGVPWLTWVLGGVAVGGGVGFGALWSLGMNDVQEMRQTCAPSCTQERIDEVRPTFLAARISLGVGIAAALGALAAYALQPTASSRPRGFAERSPLGLGAPTPRIAR